MENQQPSTSSAPNADATSISPTNDKKFAFTPQIKENILPPVGYTIALGAFIFQVSYRNPGKMRFSLEFIGMTLADKKDSKPFAVTRDGKKMSVEDFTEWQREKFPKPHEAQRNPENTTLDVQSTHSAAKGGL